MELVVLIVLLVGGIAGVAWFNKPKTELTAPPQEVDTKVPPKGVPSDELIVLKEKTLNRMTKAQISEELEKLGVEHAPGKTKASLIQKYLDKVKH